MDLAVAVARWGITFNAIRPGMLMTEQTEHIVNEHVIEKVKSMTPVGRFGEPHEVAHAVRFLASEDASPGSTTNRSHQYVPRGSRKI
jgi:3-oxoacyl-[acyl-carrier protein] reductase